MKRGPYNISKTLWQRFYEHFIVHPRTRCWVWIGAFHPRMHYGKIAVSRNGTLRYAHRVSWMIHHGPIPEGLCVLHRCDHGYCVNPDHLFLGTQTDNMVDKEEKGRLPLGSKCHNAKLTEDQVRQIRSIKGMIPRKIGELFGIGREHVRDILSRRIWRHI